MEENLTLSILCVTDGKPHALSFLVSADYLARKLRCEFILGLDGDAKKNTQLHQITYDWIHLPDHEVGLQECVLDEAVKSCSGDYILRLDDDEK